MHPSYQQNMIRHANHLLAMRAIPEWTMQQQQHAEWLAHCAVVASRAILRNRIAAKKLAAKRVEWMQYHAS